MSFWKTIYKIAEVGTTTISTTTALANYAITPMNMAQQYQEALNSPTAVIQEEQPHWLDDQVQKAVNGYVYDDGKESITIDKWLQNMNPDEADIEEIQKKDIEEKTKELEKIQNYERDHDYGDEPFHGVRGDPYKEAEQQYIKECRALEADYEKQNQELTAQFQRDSAKAQEEEETRKIQEEYEKEFQRLETEYQQKSEEAQRAYEAKIEEIGKKQMEEARKDHVRMTEEAKAVEEENKGKEVEKAEEVKKDEEVRKTEEAKKAEEIKNTEESKASETVPKTEEGKVTEGSKQREEAKQQEVTKQAKDSNQKEAQIEEDNGIDR